MFKITAAFALITIALGAVVPNNKERIFGGSEVDIEYYPYTLSLQYKTKHICGASIISANKALTAAQCVQGIFAFTRFFKVRASTSIRETGGQLIQVTSICEHRNYSPWSNDNDVAVLLLEAEIVLGPGAQPVILASATDEVADNALGTVTGWGDPSLIILKHTHLQEVDLPKISDVSCKLSYGKNSITPSMICFGNADGTKDACKGDEGSPIVVGGRQVGIASWGRGCAKVDYPRVFAKISALRSHIDSC